MALEVTVDHGLCLGAQRCIYLAAGVFELNGSSQAEVVDPTAIAEAELVEIARQCPNFAITVVRDGEVLVSGD
jgi:ferredoxin